MEEKKAEGKKWWQSKTIWTGVAGLVTTAGAYAAGEIGSAAALQTGVTALIGIFLRMGMLK